MLPFFLKLFTNAKPPPSDAELLRLYRQTGELEHLGELFQRHSEMVYLVCLKYLREEEESKDATMHLFEHLATALLQHEVSNFKSWLYATAKNHCLMQLRAKKGQPGTGLDETSALFVENQEPLHLSEAEQREETEQLLQQALQQLPPAQYTCVELFYLQQKSYKEIADLTGHELSKVKSYIQNGKRNLKIYMEKHHAPR
ncbi:RNA polymerase sigma factor [Pontibacter actiniarum]|uniref:RNA polymerase subunit sigma-24 n=1 Tax=Pontibacter actiniarum TaxID=323450 RepID=A0A1X9YNU0_9BACT|nr:sigma-70 family RNA polymerase sigma factor [Pontibacter actiniarum]ARS34555.1 RNA polymerase subunit sigma-24 [Pontibacter actiniarum]